MQRQNDAIRHQKKDVKKTSGMKRGGDPPRRMSERLASYFTAASMELVFSLSFAALIFWLLFDQAKSNPPRSG